MTSLQDSLQQMPPWDVWTMYGATPILTYTTSIFSFEPLQWTYSYGEQRLGPSNNHSLTNSKCFSTKSFDTSSKSPWQKYKSKEYKTTKYKSCFTQSLALETWLLQDKWILLGKWYEAHQIAHLATWSQHDITTNAKQDDHKPQEKTSWLKTYNSFSVTFSQCKSTDMAPYAPGYTKHQTKNNGANW